MSTAVASLIAAAPAARAEDPPDQIIRFANDDPGMNAAIEKARNGLARYWRKR